MEGQRDRGVRLLALLTCLALATTACTIGPTYQTPLVQVPAGYKELNGWKAAQPSIPARSSVRGPKSVPER